MENKRYKNDKVDFFDFLKSYFEDKNIKLILFIAFLVILLGYLIISWIIYEKQGVKKLNFKISKVLVVSSTNANRVENTDNKNDKKRKNEKHIETLHLSHATDVYIKLDEIIKQDKEKNNDFSSSKIDKIIIKNFHITQKPNVGTISILKPSGNLENLFTNSKQDYMDKSIEFKGNNIDSTEELETSKDGGIFAFRINNTLGKYTVNENDILTYDNSLLKKYNFNPKDLDFKMTLDIEVVLENHVKYQTTLTIENPEIDIHSKNNSLYIPTDSLVFKRIK